MFPRGRCKLVCEHAAEGAKLNLGFATKSHDEHYEMLRNHYKYNEMLQTVMNAYEMQCFHCCGYDLGFRV